MKVLFRQQLPVGWARPFAVYGHDCPDAPGPARIDLQAAVRKHLWAWLDEVQREHADVSRRFLSLTRWWWITPMARLDVRPWAQDYLVEPLFFAKAFVLWSREHAGESEVVLIGCDPLVALYLGDLAPALILDGAPKFGLTGLLLKLLTKGLARVLHTTFTASTRVARHHLFRARYEATHPTVILSESVLDSRLLSGYRYFYFGLFDSLPPATAARAEYACLSEAATSADPPAADAGIAAGFLMDGVTPAELALSCWYSVVLVFASVLVTLRTRSFFWAHFIASEAGRACYLRSLVTYYRLKTLFSSGVCRQVVYPYEGKGVEKAILYACRETGVRAIGFLPHPQYRLALSLRDGFEPMPPRPDVYAVCGEAYVGYLVGWGGKSPNSIVVWGSNKHGNRALVRRRLDRDALEVALLISHPDELRVFDSWLRREPRLRQGIRYAVRVYKAASPKVFDDLLGAMGREFDFVHESQGSLADTLSNCHLAVFCATSAGVSAISSGIMSIYVDVKGLLPMNACFDDVASLFPSESAAELADNIGALCAMDGDALASAHERQLELAGRVFGAPRAQVISRMME